MQTDSAVARVAFLYRGDLGCPLSLNAPPRKSLSPFQTLDKSSEGAESEIYETTMGERLAP